MATSKDYYYFISESLSHVNGVSLMAMMGEYVIYYQGKVVGGVYDNRLLVKITPSSLRLLPCANREYPYPGGKQMLAVDDIENRELLESLIVAIAGDLPLKKRRKAEKECKGVRDD